MVCSEDIKDKVKQVLNLPATPATATSTSPTTYSPARTTCRWDLWCLRSDSPAARRGRYFTACGPPSAPPTPSRAGRALLRHPAGTVVVLKDSQTLGRRHWASQVFGAQHQKRTDLAYEIASDVLGCWTGDE